MVDSPRFLGIVLNFFRFPGFVQPCHYVSDLFAEDLIDIKVTNTKSGRYTMINVNGLDIYFNWRSGKIDGIGIKNQVVSL